MFDKFDMWKYRDTSNCWDYVRAWMIERAGVPVDDVPKFGICPTNKRAMTKAAILVARAFKLVNEPEQNAIACQYHGKVLEHVGIVDGKYVRHVSSQRGCVKELISKFAATGVTTYYVYS